MTRALAAAQPPECYGGIICPSDCPCTPRMRRAKRTLEAALRRYLKADTEAARILAPVTPPDTPGLARRIGKLRADGRAVGARSRGEGGTGWHGGIVERCPRHCRARHETAGVGSMIQARGWYAAKTRCRVCGYEDVSVFPSETDPDTMQCDRCHQNTCEAVAYIGTDGIVREVEHG